MYFNVLSSNFWEQTVNSVILQRLLLEPMARFDPTFFYPTIQ